VSTDSTHIIEITVLDFERLLLGNVLVSLCFGLYERGSSEYFSQGQCDASYGLRGFAAIKAA